MQPNATALANRLEGRLFSAEGRLYLVVAVDTQSGFARVSYRADGKQQISEMLISDVGLGLTCMGYTTGQEGSGRRVHAPS